MGSRAAFSQPSPPHPPFPIPLFTLEYVDSHLCLICLHPTLSILLQAGQLRKSETKESNSLPTKEDIEAEKKASE